MKLLLCALAFAAFGATTARADDGNAKVTLVYEHALPNVPGKSIKGVLVEYGPGGSSAAHTHPSVGLHLCRPCSKGRSEAR